MFSFGSFGSSSSSSSSSTSSSGSGGKYNPVLRFDWDVLNHNEPDRIETLPEFSHSKLLDMVEHYPEFKTEKILLMTIYKHRLENSWLNFLPTVEDYRFHAFIVFETDNKWFYSIEKYSQRVSFQRARELRGVRDLDSWCERLNSNHAKGASIEIVKSDAGKGTVANLINIVYKEELVLREYDFMTENCKHFASIIYNQCSNGSCTLDDDLPHPCNRG